MKKSKVIFGAVIFALALVFGNVPIAESAPGSGGGGSSPSWTCYSTYSEPLIGGTTIWACGSPCFQVKAKNFSDSSTCQSNHN